MQPSYDAVSNVVGVKTTLPQGTDTQAFCYDEQNRLTWAGATGTPSCGASLTAGTLTAAQYSASYSYDTLDRLTASPLGSYTYGDTAHLHAATAIGPSGGIATWTTSYDASGNTACRAATTATTCAGTTPNGALLSYDNEGRLTAWQNIANVTTTPTSTPAMEEALYDGEGQRVQQLDESNASHTATLHTYVGGTEDIASQWANTGGSVTTTTTAYYAIGLAQSVNGALNYTLGDGLGSVSASVNASGTVTASQLYGPYGAVRYQNGTLPTDFAFTHQRADATSGLDYYGARYYDPLAGQFTSADSTLAGGLNRYGYVMDNPETRTDPTGHMYALPKSGSPGICISMQACWIKVPGGTVPSPSSPHVTGFPHTSYQDLTPPWAQTFTLASGGYGGHLAYVKNVANYQGEKLDNPTVRVSGYTRANGTEVQPYWRRPAGAAAAAEDARLYGRAAGWVGWGLVGIGAAVDAGVTGYDYYQSEDASDPNRFEKAAIAGAAHSILSTGVAVLFVTGVTFIPGVGESGVAQVVAGMAGSYVGGLAADWLVTPERVDGAASMINSSSSAISNAWGSVFG